MKTEALLSALACLILSSLAQNISDCEFYSMGISISCASIQEPLSEVSEELMKLRVEWWHLNLNDIDTHWVGIWDKNPNYSLKNPLKTFELNKSNGYYLVEIEIREKIHQLVSKKNISEIPNCFPIWVAYIQNYNDIILSSCWEINSFWLENLKSQLYWKSLSSIFLPGISQIGNNSLHPNCANNFPWCELVMGSRYFKLLVEVDQEYDIKFYINVFGKYSLIKFLIEIQTFISKTREFIILDIVLSNKMFYNEMEDIILTLLHDYIITKEYRNSHLGDLWNINRRISITSSQSSQSEYIHKDLKNISYTKYFSRDDISNELKTDEIWILNVGETYENKENVHDTQFFSRLKNDLWKFLNIVTFPCIFCTDIVKLAKDINKRRNYCPEYEKVMRLLRKVARSQPKIISPLNVKEICNDANKVTSKIEVWPTIKAKPSYINDRQKYRLIQINWKTPIVENGDLVAVFSELPCVDCVISLTTGFMNSTNTTTGNQVKYSTPLFYEKPQTPQGVITTSISHGRPKVAQLAKGGCVGHWVAYLRNQKIESSRCISSYPKWMWDNREIIGNIPLPDLIIPGTHNSGSYFMENSVDPVNKWIVCQDESILNQLLLGVRYLDLRVGYYPETKELMWINHDMIRWVPLYKALEDIKAFSFISPDPVIIDIHRTPVGFDKDEAVQLLLSLLNSTLGDYLAPYPQKFTITPNDLWKSGKTLILSYGVPWFKANSPIIWPLIYQAWADAQNLEDLKKFLDADMDESKHVNLVWAAMGHLTASMWDIIFKSGDGIRGAADKTNRALTEWLAENWKQNASIVTADFILSSDIIATSIRLSLQEGLCKKGARGTLLRRPH